MAKRKVNEFNTANQFCGAGCCEVGIRDAVVDECGKVLKGVAINHWDRAVDTMRVNFPEIKTLSCKIEEALPDEVIPPGTVLHLLWSSPACTHFSRAKGGKPRSKQVRALAEYVTSWASIKRPWFIIVENVPEFVEWGPLTDEGLPDKAHKGDTFKAWVHMIESLGYNVEHRVLCCADYGDATTRKRFFMIAVRNDIGVPVWPKPTHGNNVEGLKQWRGVKECLDLGNPGQSIFGRKRTLATKTLARIAKGAQKYWGLDLTTDMLVKACSGTCTKPIVVKFLKDWDVGKAFIAKLNNGATTEDVDDPLTTALAGGNHHALVQAKPFIAKMRHNATVDSVDAPITTASAGGRHHAVCSLVCDHFGGGKLEPLEQPLRTQPTHGRTSLVTLVCDHKRNGKAVPATEPVPTQTTKARSSMVTLVLGQNGASACRPATEPCPTVACKGAVRAIEPIVVDNANGGINRGAHEPINTITLKDQHMVVYPILEDGRRLDILMRMLEPRELARAHSLPDDFVITGNKTEQTKQIGNGVPARTARALVSTLLKEYIE